jgi:hypothetical protein
MSIRPDTNDEQRNEPEDDVEGHALPLVRGVDALARGRTREKAGPRADEALPPLTKPFPSLKSERPR